TLIALDDYTKPNCKFRDLFFKHQEALFNNVIDTGKVLKAMDEHRYIDVAAEMSKINQRKDGDAQVERAFEELKNSLSRSLRALAKTTLMRVLTLGDNEVDLENMINLDVQLQTMEDAKNSVFEYADNNTKKEIEKIESETKSSIERWLFKVVAIVKAAIKSYKFWEAEEKIKLVRKVNCILGSHFEQISFDDSKEEKVKGKIFNSVDQLEQQLQNVLETVVKKYKNIDLKIAKFNPYVSDPPKNLYAKLDKVMHTASTYNYKESWDAIEEDITQKVRDQLQEIRKQVKEFDWRKLETRVRFCESVLNSLPKHMRKILGDEIKQCHDDIKCDLENSAIEVEQVTQKRNVQDINELLNSSTSNQKRNIEEKESLVKRATSSGQVGLFTRAFGRGIDFVYRDQIVAANGGVHVIQTSLSEELSEEVQIKGRTARQGSYGSYSLILCDKFLKKQFISTVKCKAV
ncbi:hypothetical protein RFI_34580, partial [Reticulomyxa filosa]